VLDLTRVIAGPVGTRMLGALGAAVLRVDDPRRPELPLHAVDGVIGKSSTLVDAGFPVGREILDRLVAEADVVVTGYRPGALRRLGLDRDQIIARHPGKVVATLSAWGESSGWAGRRGFDSLVQIATGIGWASAGDTDRPGALPCQLLDHASGYLLAAGILTALARGEGAHVTVSLAGTAQWLLAQKTNTGPADTAGGHPNVDRFMTALGNGWTGVSPPGVIDGHALTWPSLPPRYGGCEPTFR
jgi:crotonobetainyl-CoA:carnitine CoA-transferase CaiB-like acyl-CoA transferase